MTAAVLSLALGGGLAAAQTPDPPGPRLGISVGTDGRISMGAFPESSEGFRIVYGYPSTGTSFTTIRIDGQDVVFGSTGSGGGEGAPATAGGTFTQPCAGDATQNTCVWAYGDVSVTQRVQVTANPQTGKNDAALISYQLNNTGTTAHAVGVRTMLDTQLGDNDGAPFRVAGSGNITTEREFAGGAVPDDFLVFQDLASTSRVASGTLRGGFAVEPSRFVIADWRGISRTLWDYTTDPNRAITDDSAYAAYWNPTPLAPGASRTYSTYYGLGTVSVDNSPPVGLGVTGPASLTATDTGYTPNPFDVTATISANSNVPARNVVARINLPAGLSTTDPVSRPVGDVNPGDPERTLNWSVTAAPQAQAQTLTYSVTVTADGVAPKTVTRTITIPAARSTVTVVSGNNQSVPVNTAFAPLVAGVNSGSAPVAGQQVTFAVTSGSARFANNATTATATTGADGRATAPTLTAGATPGPVTVTASVPNAAPATFNETVTGGTAPAGNADVSVRVVNPTAAPSGTPFQTTVTLTNAGPAAATNVTGTFLVRDLTITNGGGGVVSADGKSVTFTRPSLAAGQSVTFQVTVTSPRGLSGTQTLYGGVSSRVADPNNANNTQRTNVTITP